MIDELEEKFEFISNIYEDDLTVRKEEIREIIGIANDKDAVGVLKND